MLWRHHLVRLMHRCLVVVMRMRSVIDMPVAWRAHLRTKLTQVLVQAIMISTVTGRRLITTASSIHWKLWWVGSPLIEAWCFESMVHSALRTYGQCENFTCIVLQQGSLEAQNSLWVQYGGWLRPTAIDILSGEVLRRAFPMLQDLINSEYLAEHDS